MIRFDPNNIGEDAFATSEVATDNVEVDLNQVRLLLKTDGEFFIEFFLAEQLDMPVPSSTKRFGRNSPILRKNESFWLSHATTRRLRWQS
jgi:hypothetical protein